MNVLPFLRLSVKKIVPSSSLVLKVMNISLVAIETSMAGCSKYECPLNLGKYTVISEKKKKTTEFNFHLFAKFKAFLILIVDWF